MNDYFITMHVSSTLKHNLFKHLGGIDPK